MKIEKIRETDLNKERSKNILKKAGQIIKNGGLVAFPTETVYGLGADALNPQAAEKIYKAKGRPSDNPLIVHIAEFESLRRITKEIPWQAKKLADAFWPGPLTMILKKAECVPLATTGGLQTVAVRMPANQVALELIKAAGGYIAAPSANLSGRPSPTKASHVARDLNGAIDMLVDGGSVGIGLESTIVDLTENKAVILRPGAISAEMMFEWIGEVQLDQALIQLDDSIRPKAPGMKYKHYAPQAEMTIVEGSPGAVIDKINACVKQTIQEKYDALYGEPVDVFLRFNVLSELETKIGILCVEENRMSYPYGIVKSIGSIENEEEIARNLYAVLREFDDTQVELIFSESFRTPKLGYVIMNRLLKAAGGRVLKVG